ncbi:helix-turn-helix transcriptional regulator [Azospirillum sp. sgz301742]
MPEFSEVVVKVLRFKQVHERVGYSRMHLFRMEREGRFPKRIPLGPNSVGWLESEVDAWIAARVAKRDAEPAFISSDSSADNLQS